VNAQRLAALSLSAVVLAFGLGALAQRFGGWPFPVPAAVRLEGAISDPSALGQGRFGTPPELARTGETAYLTWDPVAGHVHVPNARLNAPWPEYARGKVKLRTNNLGLRRDEDTALEPPPNVARVLVLGDSHVDGFVDNDESFCRLLERRLGEAGRPSEVLNGGVITSGPHNYVGHVERFFHLGLDLVVVVLYSGNDFLNAVTTAAVRGSLAVPERSGEYLDQIERSFGVQPIQQGPNQARFFREFEALEGPAVAEVGKQMRWLRHLSEKGGFELLIAVLPSKFEIEWPSWPAERVAADEAAYLTPLGLARADLAVNRRMADELLSVLRADGLATLDLTEALRAAGGKLFWDGDYHLSEAGHAVVAEALYAPLVERLARR
jgi:lysophospholipase L1-like esterase